jgi:hypothetical protein
MLVSAMFATVTSTTSLLTETKHPISTGLCEKGKKLWTLVKLTYIILFPFLL